MDDRDRVAAIRAHDPQGLASAYEAYASALYTFCRSMLGDEHAAQDAVHDTFIILDERVRELRDPDRLRPWLYAIARSQCLRQLRARIRTLPTEDVGDVMDHHADVTVDIESTQLQALVWDALAGLNSGERAALEMSLRHGLVGADLADALGVSHANAKKLVQRGKDDLEKGLGALLLARAPSTCAALAELTSGWDGRLDPLMRKRLSRHIESCASCGDRKRREVNASALLAALPLLAVPVAVTRRLHQSLRLVSDDDALDRPAHMSNSSLPSLAARERRVIARSAGQFDRDGFPITHGPLRRNLVPIVAAATAVAATAIVLIGPAGAEHHSANFNLFPITTVPTISSTNPSTTPASTAGTKGTRQAATTGVPTNGTVTGAATAPLGHPTAVPVRSHDSSTATTPPTSPVGPGVLELSSSTLDLGTKASGNIQLVAKGAPVTWTASASPGITVKPGGDTTTSTEYVAITIDRSMYPKAGSTVVEFSWATGKVLLSLTWGDGA